MRKTFKKVNAIVCSLSLVTSSLVIYNNQSVKADDEKVTVVAYQYDNTGKEAKADLVEYTEGEDDYTYLSTTGTGTLVASVTGDGAKHISWSKDAYANASVDENGEVQSGSVPVVGASTKNPWSADANVQFTFSTTNYEDLSFSIDLGATKKGPRDYKLTYVDAEGNEQVIGDTISLSDNKTMQTTKVDLPETLANQESVTITLKLASTTSLGKTDIVTESVDGGEFAINNIVVTGIQTETPDETTITETATDATTENVTDATTNEEVTDAESTTTETVTDAESTTEEVVNVEPTTEENVQEESSNAEDVSAVESTTEAVQEESTGGEDVPTTEEVGEPTTETDAEEDTALVAYRYSNTDKEVGADLDEYTDGTDTYTYRSTTGTGTLTASITGDAAKHISWSADAYTDADGNELGIVPVVGASKSNNWTANANVQFTFSTVDYTDLSFSLDLGATKKGPKNYQLVYTDAEGAEQQIGDVITLSDNKTLFTFTVDLPEALENQESVTVTLKLADTEAMNGTDVVLDSVKGGEFAINNIVVTGTKSDVEETETAGEETTEEQTVQLATPEGLAINDNIFSWQAVENAESYIVTVDGNELDATVATEIDLSDVLTETKTYTITVKAVAEKYDDSQVASIELENEVAEPTTEETTVAETTTEEVTTVETTDAEVTTEETTTEEVTTVEPTTEEITTVETTTEEVTTVETTTEEVTTEETTTAEVTTAETTTEEVTTVEPTTVETTTTVEETTTVETPETTTATVETTTATETTTVATTVKLGKTKVKTATKKKFAKKLKITLKKIKNAHEYQIAVYKTKKNAKKNKNAILKKTITKVKVTLKGKKLKGKKKLYVRARAAILVTGGTSSYGKWSKIKAVKIKK